ncbi:DNA-directed RNA polymerase subunit K [Candidatus Micrarchaeota archaeon]|nr:DNA-directed RNA polymerase subunit K [Candidatus Micrarchaeota archaeon]MBI5177125.1 DNA-directed RNA polymerase subunit K [Candidatus Micrarchaeota archaeon]
MPKTHSETLTHYERARLVGARALQLAMGAPPLVKAPGGLVSAVKLAFLEFEKSAIPLKVVHDAA